MERKYPKFLESYIKGLKYVDFKGLKYSETPKINSESTSKKIFR